MNFSIFLIILLAILHSFTLAVTDGESCGTANDDECEIKQSNDHEKLKYTKGSDCSFAQRHVDQQATFFFFFCNVYH